MEFATHCAEECDRLERELSDYVNEPPLRRRFFKPPPVAGGDSPAHVVDPNAYRAERLSWRIGDIDLEHPQPWTRVEDGAAVLDLVVRLREWEGFDTWSETSRARVVELGLDDQSTWYQLRLDRRGRLFGFRLGSIFHILWWDRDHVIYETTRRT